MWAFDDDTCWPWSFAVRGQAVQEPGVPYPVLIVLVLLFTQPHSLDGVIVVPVRLVALCATVLMLVVVSVRHAPLRAGIGRVGDLHLLPERHAEIEDAEQHHQQDRGDKAELDGAKPLPCRPNSRPPLSVMPAQNSHPPWADRSRVRAPWSQGAASGHDGGGRCPLLLMRWCVRVTAVRYLIS